MTDSIDTKIPGSTESVHSAADWLFTLRDNISDADELFGSCKKEASSNFDGKMSLAVETYCRRVEGVSQQAYDNAKKAADVTRAFANQLGWRQDDMANHRGRASDGGLEVTDYVIHAPKPVDDPGSEPKNATSTQKKQWQADCDAYEAYTAKQELFDELREDVNHTFEELTNWINDNLATAESDILSKALTAALRSIVVDTVKGTAAQAAKNHYSARAQELRDKAIEAATKKARPKSGNPAVRESKVKEPSKNAINNKINNSPKLSGMMDKADDMMHNVTTAIKAVNVATTLGFMGVDLANGDSPGKVLVATAGGVAGGAVAGAAVASSSGVIIPALTVAAGSAAVAWGAGYVYEHTVPLHVRDRFDEGARDLKDGFVDGLKSLGDSLAHGGGGRFN